MSRYSTTSISLAMRPCPGTMRVPPMELYSGMAMSTRRFSASMTPCSVPPRFAIDHGIAVRARRRRRPPPRRTCGRTPSGRRRCGRPAGADLNRLAGDEQRLLRGGERVGRPQRHRRGIAPVGRIGEPRVGVLVGVDPRALLQERVDRRPGRGRQRLRCRPRDRDRPTCSRCSESAPWRSCGSRRASCRSSRRRWCPPRRRRRRPPARPRCCRRPASR